MLEGLILRLIKALPLSAQEMDNNLQLLSDAFDALEGLFGVVLNPNGTLKDNSVSTNAIRDRAVTLRKLAFLSLFYARDTGAADAMVITFDPAATAYAEGMVFFVKALANNTGATTLNVDGLGPKNVKRYISTGSADLALGNIIAGGVYIMTYDGTEFICANPNPIPSAATPTTARALTNSGSFWDLPLIASTTQIAHNLSPMPDYLQIKVVLVCKNANNGYLVNDEIQIESVTADLSDDGAQKEVECASYTVGWDSTYIYISKVDQGAGGSFQGDHIAARDGGGFCDFDSTEWGIKIYMLHSID